MGHLEGTLMHRPGAAVAIRLQRITAAIEAVSGKVAEAVVEVRVSRGRPTIMDPPRFPRRPIDRSIFHPYGVAYPGPTSLRPVA